MTNETAKSGNNTRPPVVVVLGHVDHGKSSILEAIKDLKITSKESGGITQHIGAYEIEHEGKTITFIDTPGHEAFSAMRARGAKVADIAILVVAAEEGLKPQTKEAIQHIKDADIPMIVAINKIDKAEANPEKVKGELFGAEVQVESMGGNVPSVNVSATKGTGITELVEMINLLAELENFQGDPTKPAEGVVIESYKDTNRGPIATIVLTEGTLKPGDVLGTVSTTGKVKGLENFQGKHIKEALPSMPTIILGFSTVPGVGETVKVYPSLKEAEEHVRKQEKVIFEDPEVEEGQRVLNLILKVDVVGSLEALKEVLSDIPQDKVVFRVLKAEVGEINDSDIKLAVGSNAKIVGFRVKTNPIAKKLALREKVTVMDFEIIYEIVEAIRNLLEKMVRPELVREDLGKMEVLEIFRTEKNRQIIGGRVREGRIKRGALLEIIRNEEVIGKGKIVKLQQEKKEVDEVGKRMDCGILYQGKERIEQGDILQAYTEERVKGEL